MELVINCCQVGRKEAAVSAFRSLKTWDKFGMTLQTRRAWLRIFIFYFQLWKPDGISTLWQFGRFLWCYPVWALIFGPVLLYGSSTALSDFLQKILSCPGVEVVWFSSRPHLSTTFSGLPWLTQVLSVLSVVSHQHETFWVFYAFNLTEPSTSYRWVIAQYCFY